ncbi:MAG: AarF/UbiB family protein [Sorangiineae bacterium]|nr:AarF/UbiB family protein [Polyangiaceae bacterium]MEB2323474.1 AarF/UbiB family protein [Sorangiineae bacterium]
MRLLRIWLRTVTITLVCLVALAGYLARRVLAGRSTAEARERLRGESLSRLLERLGATFIKFGQILSTRPDLLGPGYIEPLARLQDSVPPAPFEAIEAMLARELSPRERARIVTLEPMPIAAASVAQVHRGVLDDERVVAVKAQRPEVEAQVDRDLSILSFGARLLDRIPTVRMLSLPGSVARFAVALRGQLDFRAEADNNRRFAKNFSGVPNVGVPGLVDDLCTRRVLVMDFIEGVKATEPEKVGGDRAALARVGGETVLKMVFHDGFVHADLHPGNIILTPDGRVVLIDLGMVTDIPGELLRPWVETFLALAQQDSARVAELFYVYAPSVATPDYAAYQRDVEENLAGLYGKKLGEVEISEAVSSMMNVLRKHRVQVDPTFTVVNIALLVAEGLGKQLDPTIDLMPMAMPYLSEAMLTAPPGRAPLRELPAAVAG